MLAVVGVAGLGLAGVALAGGFTSPHKPHDSGNLADGTSASTSPGSSQAGTSNHECPLTTSLVASAFGQSLEELPLGSFNRICQFIAGGLAGPTNTFASLSAFPGDGAEGHTVTQARQLLARPQPPGKFPYLSAQTFVDEPTLGNGAFLMTATVTGLTRSVLTETVLITGRYSLAIAMPASDSDSRPRTTQIALKLSADISG